MALETGTYIEDLNANNPDGNSPRSRGDDHLRLIKKTLKNSFPVDLRQLTGLTGSDEGKIITVDSEGLLQASVAGETIEEDAAITVTTTATEFSFDTETSDDLNLWDGANPTRFTMPENNLILVCTFTGSYANHTAGMDALQLNARVNGSQGNQVSLIPFFFTAGNFPETFFFVTGLSLGDYFEVRPRLFQIDTADTSIDVTNAKISIRRFF